MNIENTAPATIAFINEKGGIGKSSICFNAAWCLALEHKKRVLMIDLDGQRANVTFFAGIEKPANLPTIYDVLVDKMDIRETVLGVEDNLHIIPATSDVALLGPQNAETKDFCSAIQKLYPFYDYIFIDVSPTPNISHALALAAADFVLIPMLPDVTSLEGNMGIIESIEMAQKTINPNLKILGIVLNRYAWRPLLTGQVEATATMIAGSLNAKVFKSKIRQDVKLSENVGQNLGITSYAPKSRAAEDFRKLANEIIEEVKNHVG
jgi:chromosome partitioning protein